ncbi:MAG: chemotaxis protein CheB [Alphaproteobacteria bacterium]|nr:MAG: chemotaxis protein CheB [Alphaproteobacteria bacterium]
MQPSPYESIVIGTSAGGINALKTILPALPEWFAIPIAIVQHIDIRSDDFLAEYLNDICEINVKQAEDKEPMLAGHAYLAPPGYHLLIEEDRTFSLSVDGKVNFSCPSIDVLFDSAANAYSDRLIGVVLTGANGDGSMGLKNIKLSGGLAIVQDPATAEAEAMPLAAISATPVDYVADIDDIAALLIRLASCQYGEAYGSSIIK